MQLLAGNPSCISKRVQERDERNSYLLVTELPLRIKNQTVSMHGGLLKRGAEEESILGASLRRSER
jgi:hypothetical protein